MKQPHLLLILSDPATAQLLERNVLQPAGYEITWVDNLHTAENMIEALKPDLVIAGERFVDGDFRQLIAGLGDQNPALPVIVFADQEPGLTPLDALRLGAADYLSPPLRPDSVLDSVQRGLQRGQQWEAWGQAQSMRTTRSLRRRVDELETLASVGRSVTALLHLDDVLTAVVEAAVELTAAEEGSLLLLDETTGELYMRAARNFQDEFVRTFRLPVQDSLAGEVIQSGQPMLVDEKTPHKIKTAYLVHNLIYVPLKLQERVIGVLGVDNRQSSHEFREHHMPLLSALADYAAIAIENARLYAHSEIERQKLETILTQIDEIVIVIDSQGHFVLANRAARAAFGLDQGSLADVDAGETLGHPDLARALRQTQPGLPYQIEVEMENGRVYDVQTTWIPEVGPAITMQDITHFRELDRIKSDFVNTVSHDLRSPLTAILGYVELIERSGQVSAQQREFIRRVQLSVKNITALINDLLDLGRIEAGLDIQREAVPVAVILNYSTDGLQYLLNNKRQRLVVDLQEGLPPLLANPIRLRQMFDNLLENAVKYTPPRGEIRVQIRVEGDQMIFQVQDDGLGIPLADQPHIFDKMYRASNVPADSPGTGLGLSIVKSIVESHHGRIWVDSAPGKGSTFFVVLPIVKREQEWDEASGR